MKKTIIVCTSLALLFSCKDKKDDARKPKKQTTVEVSTENPLLQKSTLPYGAPDFTKIKNEHFRPALLEGMKQQNEAIEKIVSNTEKPTFENTIVALEESGKTLDNVTSVFYGLAGFHTNETIQKVEEELAPKFSEHSDNIYLNGKLFTRIKSVYNAVATLGLDAESTHLVKETYKNFVKAGANLTDAQKEELKKINAELAGLSNDFKKKLLDASKKGGLTVKDAKALQGLSKDKIHTCEKEGSFTFQLLNTSQQPELTSLDVRETRKALLEKSLMRTDGGDFNTNEIITKIALKKAKKAKILGFDNFASWSLQGTMAGTPKKVFDMFESLVPGTLKKKDAEQKEIQAEIKKLGGDFKLADYDWKYYAEKVRKSKYDLDESEIKPYFELTKVLEDGVFYAATQLYGITFKKRTDIPTYHPDVKVYELFEEDGSPLGLFYADYFARDSKRGGAWMSTFVKQSKLRGQKPVIYNICNYAKPAEGEPELISFTNANTMFHEFGHALHGFFANQKYASLSGTSVSRDFVEFPSQFNENWMTHPKVLKNFAKHYKTGEVIPESLLKRIKAAATASEGFSMTELLGAASLDMKWHTIPADVKIDGASKFEKDVLTAMKLNIDEIPPRYRSSYFAHIFSGGYAAGYYSYLWTAMIAYDAYDWFEDNGLLTRANGQKFRKQILSKGNTMDYAKMYKEFTGRDPQAEPMLKAKGLK